MSMGDAADLHTHTTTRHMTMETHSGSIGGFDEKLCGGGWYRCTLETMDLIQFLLPCNSIWKATTITNTQGSAGRRQRGRRVDFVDGKEN
jgi:hypothetical protein